ncbi:hypothetical protein J2W27_000361 [Variovorax boronicumulans]|uniref:hypothetical protein n=1 Tax=Variovorax boronicumulans TaxID=436515 RepID=UPI00278AE23E|nr:hypothetical protein [Variovorax boronicumulans]MDP9908268.1 hypothetical protein [Variovorax boronicumulans]
MNLLDTSPERVRAKEIQALQMAAQQLVDAARARGLVVTIDLESRMPPTMGSYDMVFDVREARNRAA